MKDKLAITDSITNYLTLDFTQSCGLFIMLTLFIIINTIIIRYFKNKLNLIFKIFLKAKSFLAPIIVTPKAC